MSLAWRLQREEKINLRHDIYRLIFFAFLLLISIILYTNSVVLESRYSIVSIDDVNHFEIALVFGGGMKEDGSMSDFQLDRVKRGIEMYHKGMVDKVMFTGDDGTMRANEVKAMKEYAIANDVLADDIIVDPAGFRTYESCYRAESVYGLKKIAAVSQIFHLPRIIYFCSSMGIQTSGVSADLREYDGLGKYWGMYGREILARVKGWWQMEITKPLPKVVN